MALDRRKPGVDLICLPKKLGRVQQETLHDVHITEPLPSRNIGLYLETSRVQPTLHEVPPRTDGMRIPSRVRNVSQLTLLFQASSQSVYLKHIASL